MSVRTCLSKVTQAVRTNSILWIGGGFGVITLATFLVLALGALWEEGMAAIDADLKAEPVVFNSQKDVYVIGFKDEPKNLGAERHFEVLSRKIKEKFSTQKIVITPTKLKGKGVCANVRVMTSI